MNYDCSSFDASKLRFDIADHKWISFQNHHRLFELLVGYIASHIVEDYGSGYRMEVLRSSNTDDSEDNPLGNTQYGRILIKIGYGEYKFRTLDGDEAYAVFQHIGEPVGGDCGPDILQNLIVFTRSLQKFGTFLSELVALSEKPEEGKFVCFTWLIRHAYWREEVRVNNRPLQSVVLPSAMKARLINDVEKFLSQKTKDFYFRNGIPYRRSYLFHGAPGTGKTSMVQALAGHFKRNVCFLMPTHPEMTDDNLREAIQSIPDNSIVVLEDIDALFTKSRENKSGKSALTFSGLLNALDGIGSPHGQLFVLTTNLRENLDHALIRNGRVDMHIEFTYAVEEQMEAMWSNFYPSAKDLGASFATSVMNSLREKKNLQITTSALQHFFITQMEATPEEALAAVSTIVEEVLRNSSASMLAEATKGKKKSNKKGKKREQEEEEEEEEESSDGKEREEIVVVGKGISLAPPPAGNGTVVGVEEKGSSLSEEDKEGEGGEGGKKGKRKRNKKNKANNGTTNAKKEEEAPKQPSPSSASEEKKKPEEEGGEGKKKQQRNGKKKGSEEAKKESSLASNGEGKAGSENEEKKQQQPQKKERQICFDFVNGECKREKCVFLHDATLATDLAVIAAAASKKAEKEEKARLASTSEPNSEQQQLPKREKKNKREPKKDDGETKGEAISTTPN